MNIAVFCGSNLGSTPAFAEGAARLGQALAAERRVELRKETAERLSNQGAFVWMDGGLIGWIGEGVPQPVSRQPAHRRGQ